MAILHKPKNWKSKTSTPHIIIHPLSAWPDDKQLARGEILDRTVCFVARHGDASSRADQCRKSKVPIRHGDDIELRLGPHVPIGDVRDLEGYKGKTTHAVGRTDTSQASDLHASGTTEILDLVDPFILGEHVAPIKRYLPLARSAGVIMHHIDRVYCTAIRQ